MLFPASLQTLLDTLTANSKIHICIHDISGILCGGELSVSFQNQIHSKPFCDAAKTTAPGYQACLRCKMLANQKAVQAKQPFSGYCLYGLYECAFPVLLDGETQCIIYVGNLLPDRDTARKKLIHACKLTGVSPEILLPYLEETQPVCDLAHYQRVGEIIASYIRFLYHTVPRADSTPAYHWAVEKLIHYIETNYQRPIILREAAALYYVNEKYIGRLFKKQTGRTFHTYLNAIRLAQAAKRLCFSPKTVTEIALDCGFQSVSYFNRLFAAQYGLTPGEFRKKNSAKR